MKLITNPLDTKIEIGVKGNQYEIEAKESLLVADDVAKQWKLTHAFIIVTEKASEPVDKVIKPEAEPMPPAEEPIVAPVKENKKKAAFSK